MPPVRTAKGTASTKAAVSTVTIPAITLKAGESLLVLVGYDNTLMNIDAVTWGAVGLVQLRGQSTGGAGLAALELWALHNAAAGTNDLVATWDGAFTLFKVVEASSALGLLLTPNDKVASAGGSSASPASGATAATAQASEFVFGGVLTNGPSEDTAGAWSNSFLDGQRAGTTGGVANTNGTISEGHKNVSSIGTQEAAKTGITSRDWAAICYTFKAAPDIVAAIGLATSAAVGQELTPVPGAVSLAIALATAAAIGLDPTVVPGAVSVAIPLASAAAVGLELFAYEREYYGAGLGVGAYPIVVRDGQSPKAVSPIVLADAVLPAPGFVPVTNPVTTYTGIPLPGSVARRKVSSKNLQSFGKAYFAAWIQGVHATNQGQAIDHPGVRSIQGGQIFKLSLIVRLDAMPIQRLSADEVHPIVSLYDINGDRAWIGITPSGRVSCGSRQVPGLLLSPNPNETLETPINAILADGKFHEVSWTIDDDWKVRKISIDQVLVISDNYAVVGGPELSNSDRGIVLFNGREAQSRVACTISFASHTHGEGDYQVYWPLNEGTGTILGFVDSQMLSLVARPEFDMVMELGWFNPTPFPTLYGSVPTGPLGSAYTWGSGTTHLRRNPAQPIYRRLPNKP